MNMDELRDKEYEYCRDEENAFYADPSDANRITALCKRDEFNRAMLRQQQAEIEALKNRELTDEEIEEVSKQLIIPQSMDYKWHIEFSRAILRKAQEK